MYNADTINQLVQVNRMSKANVRKLGFKSKHFLWICMGPSNDGLVNPGK